MKMTEIQYHPIANIFPLMPDSEIEALAKDIKENGLRNKIVLYHDKILDGRNRYRACGVAGIEPAFENYNGDDALRYVISLNLHRRHLNESQRAIVAARLANLEHGVRSDRAANLPISTPISQAEAADMLNVSERSIRTAKEIIRNNPDKVQEIEQGNKTITAVRREARREEIQKNVPVEPSGKYRVFYADPPWKYGDQLTESYGSTKYHYPVMSISDLCLLPIKELSEENAVLFMWVTSPLLDECWAVIKAWGFEYKTSFVWDKIKHNMGHYNSVRHELLLVCTKGSCLPDSPKLIDSVQSIERTEHSKKPDEFRNIIDQLYTHGKKIELFARGKYDGWDAWGNEQ